MVPTASSFEEADRVTDRLLDELVAIVGSEHLLVDPQLRAGYEVDWTRRFKGTALAVARPGTAAEVASVVAACNRVGVGIVPQGGNTGLVGGAVPRSGELVLSLRRLSRIVEVDEVAGELTAEAGVTLVELHKAAIAAGFGFAIDFAARETATVGGMIATNAGGVHVLHHGSMRAQVLGIEAALADGSVIRRLTGVHKDNTGYHLPSLLAGSEGTLGVITKARLNLIRPVEATGVALLAIGDTDVAVKIVSVARRAGIVLTAAELFFDDGLRMVLEHTRSAPPFPSRHPAYLLIEVESRTDPLADISQLLADRDGIFDAVVSDDSLGRSRLWRLRDGLSEAIGARGVPHKLDVAVPSARLAAFVQRLQRAIDSVSIGARAVIWGHVGDGNLHINVLGLSPEDDRVDDVIMRLTIEMGGSTSGEHGVGIAKTRWVAIDRDPADLAAMLAIKRALDPQGVLNPGVLFDSTLAGMVS
jgi:FAD/FMN-containing dehydrogenase